MKLKPSNTNEIRKKEKSTRCSLEVYLVILDPFGHKLGVKVIGKKGNQSNFEVLYIDNTENSNVNKIKKVTGGNNLRRKINLVWAFGDQKKKGGKSIKIRMGEKNKRMGGNT